MFFLSYLFGIKEYKYTHKEKVNCIIQHIKNDFAFKYDENDEPIGIVIHKNKKWLIPFYMCRINDCDFEKTIIIYCSDYTRKKLLASQTYQQIDFDDTTSNDDIFEINNTIEYYSEYGTYQFIRYTSRTIPITQEFTAAQKAIYESIMNTYTTKQNAISYIHGDVGKGKTVLCYIMAKNLGGSLCDSFTPTSPGSYFEDLYSRISPTKDQPFVLLLDEADVTIDQIHNQNITQHKNVPTQIYNKTTWNHFFDTIQRGLYPHLIVVLCSNISNDTINKKYDVSYLRDGRIDHCFKL